MSNHHYASKPVAMPALYHAKIKIASIIRRFNGKIKEKYRNLRRNQHTHNQAGNLNAVFGICVDVYGCADILFVVSADCVHYSSGGGYILGWGKLQILQKVGLQLILILTMLMQRQGKVVVVGTGKRICSIVNQFSQSIVINQP